VTEEVTATTNSPTPAPEVPKPSIKELHAQLRKAYDEALSSPCSGNGKGGRCYRVEVRASIGCSRPAPKRDSTSFLPNEVWGDNKWHPVSFPDSVIGVPQGRSWERFTRDGFFSYASAQALRWWLMADIQQYMGFSGLSTRLVEYEYEYSYKATPKRAVCVIDSEEREDIMPDWRTKRDDSDIEV
jgi:hypothetical protein